MTDPYELPPREEMLAAMLACDPAYEGVFVTAVHSTGVFCRPTCTARKPLPRNVSFYRTADEALAAGFRACRRCRPLEPDGLAPWLRILLADVERMPDAAWDEHALLARGLQPARVRQGCRDAFDITFAAYVRARRLARALRRLHAGDGIDGVAMDAGYDSLSGFRDAFQRTFGLPPGRAAECRLLHARRLSTPLGPMLALAEERGLVLLEFEDRPALPRELLELRTRHGYAIVPGPHAHLDHAEACLRGYFAGSDGAFDVPLHTPGSDFDRAVWAALRDIPHGATCTYGALAARIGRTTAVRAVAAANGRNRVAILIPCHRVVGADGALVGYGGGQRRKARLLRIEGRAAVQGRLFETAAEGHA
jgi:AraC family transcriptional regulator of adaptative response/methylated-DNA-[protein]-cysteine methyltransferase